MSALSINNYTLQLFDLSAKDTMNRYLKLINVDISDYTFAANFIWLSTATGFYGIVNDTFCLFILNSGTLTMLLPPIGKKENTYEAMLQCFSIMNAHNSNRNYSKIEYVHEELLEGFVDYLEEGTLVYELLKDFIVEKKLVDYIYKVDDLIELKGDSYKSKRNEINRFRKVYPNHKLEIFDKTKHSKEVLALFNKWVKDRTTYMPKEEVESFMDGIYYERFAVKRLLDNYESLDVVGLVLYINDEIKGFTVGEKINDSIASVIIEKTDFEVLGCAQFIFREFTKILKDMYNVEYINVGDDMGFENLKKVKMSYRPKKFITKYVIYQK